MKKSELDFKKSYQIYDNKISQLIKDGQDKEISKLKHQVEAAIREWEEVRKQAKWRSMMLRNLLGKINSFGGK